MSELQYLLNELAYYGSGTTLTVGRLTAIIEAAIDRKAKEDAEFEKIHANANNDKKRPW